MSSLATEGLSLLHITVYVKYAIFVCSFIFYFIDLFVIVLKTEYEIIKPLLHHNGRKCLGVLTTKTGGF